jgi:hypothetical protein
MRPYKPRFCVAVGVARKRTLSAKKLSVLSIILNLLKLIFHIINESRNQQSEKMSDRKFEI